MLFLKKATFLGLHFPDQILPLDFTSKMTILTGFNGSGKTSALIGIYFALNHIGKPQTKKDFLYPRKNWGTELEIYDNNFSIDYKDDLKSLSPLPKVDLKLSLRYIVLEDNIKEVNLSIIKDPFKDNLKKFREKIVNSLDSVEVATQKSAYIYIPKERTENSTEVFALEVGIPPYVHQQYIKVLDKYRRSLERSREKLSVALYIDEKLYCSFNEKNNNELAGLDVFSKNNNLDRSIFVLLQSFREQALSSKENFSNAVFDEIKKYKIKENSEFDEMKEYFSEILDKNRYTNEALYFIEKLDLFFNQINKKSHISDDGSIYFTENKKIINWYDCSKGEKNLLCLLLIVFLFRNKNTIFIFDEPDLSIHIEWQSKLLQVFLELAPNSQFFISTHSPALIPADLENIDFINMNEKKQVEH